MAIDLREQFSGCMLKTKFIGCSRTMTQEQMEKVAELFSADENSLRGNREIILKSHTLVQAVRSPIRRAKRLWADYTIKFEDGLRLIRRSRILWLTEEVAKCQADLAAAAAALRAGWREIIADARERLRDLFNAADYDLDPESEFALALSFPAIEPDKALKALSPELYEQERDRVRHRFEDAANRAEAAMLKQLQEMLARLADKLAPVGDGEAKKRLSPQAVDAIGAFAEHFQELCVGSGEELKALVETARVMADDINVKAVNQGLGAQELAATVAKIQAGLEAQVQLKPKRLLQV